jgi:predicted small secreted protein
MHRMLRYAVIIVLVGALAGCATWQGMKEDVKTLGRGIENVTK